MTGHHKTGRYAKCGAPKQFLGVLREKSRRRSLESPLRRKMHGGFAGRLSSIGPPDRAQVSWLRNPIAAPMTRPSSTANRHVEENSSAYSQ